MQKLLGVEGALAEEVLQGLVGVVDAELPRSGGRVQRDARPGRVCALVRVYVHVRACACACAYVCVRSNERARVRVRVRVRACVCVLCLSAAGCLPDLLEGVDLKALEAKEVE